MASVFRSFLRSDHRFPCRYSDLPAQGAFISPRPAFPQHLRGHYKRPDRHPQTPHASPAHVLILTCSLGSRLRSPREFSTPRHGVFSFRRPASSTAGFSPSPSWLSEEHSIKKYPPCSVVSEGTNNAKFLPRLLSVISRCYFRQHYL